MAIRYCCERQIRHYSTLLVDANSAQASVVDVGHREKTKAVDYLRSKHWTAGMMVQSVRELGFRP
jgi:hypothetical protein